LGFYLPINQIFGHFTGKKNKYRGNFNHTVLLNYIPLEKRPRFITFQQRRTVYIQTPKHFKRINKNKI
jgi:hypothetical protein